MTSLINTLVKSYQCVHLEIEFEIDKSQLCIIIFTLDVRRLYRPISYQLVSHRTKKYVIKISNDASGEFAAEFSKEPGPMRLPRLHGFKDAILLFYYPISILQILFHGTVKDGVCIKALKLDNPHAEKRNSHKYEAAAQPPNSEPAQRMQRNQLEKENREEHKEELSSPQLARLQEGYRNKYAFQRNKQEPNVNGAGSGVGGESEGCAANSQDNVPANQSNKLPVGICIRPSEDECNSNNPMTTTCAKERMSTTEYQRSPIRRFNHPVSSS
ncbi:hypothetical protein Aperf_G00000082644 [Anoplocephala perfoliata]